MSPPETAPTDDLRKALREEFGLERLRHGQEEVMRGVLAGRSVLAVMPTGAGKSLCYQLPGLQLEGTTVIVSPLISLMKDQVDKLVAMGHAARRLDSTVAAADERRTLDELDQGAVEFLFVTPERLAREDFLERLAGAPLDFVVIDEAHCVSRWGHDFRPDYLEIGGALDRLGRPPFLALTATAGPEVVADLREHLHCPDLVVVETGVYRSNLRPGVEQVEGDEEKRPRVTEAVADLPETGGSAIVYTATIRHAEEVAEHLGVPAYHGKLARSRREEVQDGFMGGELPVVVATNAFGMGIDKPDIRLVLHYDLPASVDAYYQEAGRAGRDGEPARCLLLYDPADAGTQKALLASGRGRNGDEGDERAEEDRERLARMERYAQTALCRWANLVAYFDPEQDEPAGWWCGHCDNCEHLAEGEALGARRRPAEPEVEPLAVRPLRTPVGDAAGGEEVSVGTPVTVPVYGEGVVTAVDPSSSPGRAPGWVEVELRDGGTRRFRAPEGAGTGADGVEAPSAAGESPFETGLAGAIAAERRIVDTLPELGEAARDPELRKSLRQALGRARDRLERLAQVRRPDGSRPAGPEATPGADDETPDEVLERLLSEGRGLADAVRDGRNGQSGSDDALLAVARRIVEHRTAAYGRLALAARMDGLEPQADDLDEIVVLLAESGERLAGLVVGRIHPAASRDLDDLTRDQLYKRARELDVPGRSRMNKAELRQAVAEHAGSAAM